MVPWPLLLLAPLVDVAWNVPEDCPSEAAFVQMVESQADVRTDAGAPPVLAAEVTVQSLGADRWALTLRLRREDEVDERRFDGDSCEAVVEAAALMVSLRVLDWTGTIVPEPIAEPAPAEPASDPDPPPPEDVDPPAPTRVTEVPRRDPDPPIHRDPIEIGGWLALQAGVGFGVSPGVSGGVALEGGVEGRWWRAGVALQTMPRSIVEHPSDASVDGRFDLLVAQVFGCGVPSAGPVEFPVCGRIAGGALRGEGRGAVEQTEPAWGDWWGVGGSAAVVWHAWKRVAPTISAEALAPLRTRSYSVGDVPGVLHRTGPVAFRAWVGLEIHL